MLTSECTLVGGKNLEEGSSVKAVVLDISRSDGLVDLSCKPELVNAASSAQKKVTFPIERL
jgi:predicted RNA-binding protein with RPS1 domain